MRPFAGLIKGLILSRRIGEAAMTKEGVQELTRERPDRLLQTALVMPCHHEVTAGDVSLKRLGAALIWPTNRKWQILNRWLLLPR